MNQWLKDLSLLKGISMLVLSRKIEEEIVIDGEITVKVIEFRPGRVRLGVTAPAGVRVLRKELLMGGAADSCLRSNSEGSSAESAALPSA